MALTIATISICILIVLLQHIYALVIRLMWEKLEEDGVGLYAGLTVIMIVFNYFLFNTLIQLYK